VIIVNYNGREHLDLCLSSLMELTFPKEQLEIILVDNESTDGSVDFVKSRFPNVVLIQSETNLGFSKAANLGAASASGEYLAFLNNDMRFDRNWLRLLIETARAGNGFACVGSTTLTWDGTGVDFNGRPDDAFALSYSPSDNSALPGLASGSPAYALFVSGGAALIKRSVFQALGGFDPDFFLYHEDVDLGWRLWLLGYECVLLEGPVVYHRGGASSSKLPPELIQTWSEKHTLFSVFKNLEAENLREILPLLFFFFLERERWIPAARESSTRAIREFQSSVNSLIAKRSEVQETRVRSDADIFAQLGHPFNFLLGGRFHESLRRELADASSDVAFDPNDPKSVQNAITEWLDRAHAVFEARLKRELAEKTAELAEKMAELVDKMAELAVKTAELEEKKDALRSLSVQVAEVKHQLWVKDHELNLIVNSRSWRLVMRYARVKHRLLKLFSSASSSLGTNAAPRDRQR